jgi:hypothetical protein
MRGWLTLFTTERKLDRYRTGIFLATAEAELVEKVLLSLDERFPNVRFVVVGPRAYSGIFADRGTPLWLEDFKNEPLKWLRKLRRENFDLAVAVFAGRPTFRKPKLATLLLRPRRFVIYTENVDSFELDRAHWKTAFAQLFCRSRLLHPGPLLFVPFGLLYLLGRTLKFRIEGRVRSGHSGTLRDSRVR